MNKNIISNFKKTNMFILFVCLLFFFTFLQPVYSRDENWIKASKSDYSEILNLIALRSNANYEDIATWQGKMYIIDNLNFYGTNSVKKTNVDSNSIYSKSNHIRKKSETVAEFAIDLRNNKVYSEVEPTIQYKALDLDQIIPSDKYKGRPARTRTILTPEQYIWYLTDGKFHSKSQKGPSDKMVFIESSQNENIKGFVRDPRKYFEISGGEKLWDTISKIKSDVNERINEQIGGYPYIEILYIRRTTGDKYRILTTWKFNGNFNYIRFMIEVDEAVAFNAINTMTENSDEIKTDLKEYTYEKIGELFIPKTIKIEQRNSRNEITISSEITIETTGLNKPLPEDTFTIKNLGVEEDTLVTDNIKKAEFRYSKGALVPLSEPNATPK